MEILNYILVLLISFFGLFIGMILAFIAEEEIRPGEKYLNLFKNIILILIVFFLLNAYFNVYIGLLGLLAIFLNRIDTKFIYPVLGIVFYLSSKFVNLFLIESSLIFLYGFCAGSLLSKELRYNKFKIVKKIFLRYGIYILVGIVLFFII